MNKRNLLVLIMLAVFGFSCLSGSIRGIWESKPDEKGKFQRWYFNELGEFRLENCKLKKASEKKTGEAEIWKQILLWLLNRGEQTSKKAKGDQEDFKCTELMRGEYQVTKFCDTTINCLIKPRHKLTLKPKTGSAKLLAKLFGPKELEFTRKGLTLTLGEEQLFKVRSKRFKLRDYF